MTTSADRTTYNERRRSLARRGIFIPDLFGQDAEMLRDPREWLADPDSGIGTSELRDSLDADKPHLSGPC